jgi:hypothetical protein
MLKESIELGQKYKKPQAHFLLKVKTQIKNIIFSFDEKHTMFSIPGVPNLGTSPPRGT